MKKPREPQPPYKPYKPTKPKPKCLRQIELNIPEGETSIRDIITAAGYDINSYDLNKISIYYYSDYDYHKVCLILGTNEVDTPNYQKLLDNYNFELDRYKKELIKYEKDLEIYNEKLIKWKLDMIPYNEWKDEVEKKRKQKKIKELERELFRLRK